MGWLWVESTPMRLPLRALNLRQATSSLCQPHALALGFTLSNSQGRSLATFWADTEPIYWSWVRAIAAELVRQTPFRAQRCLNFLEILTICPRGPIPLPESPTETRRRSRSELRCWPSDSPVEKTAITSTTILDDSRRRAKSELRLRWSSSNSSDEDLGEFRSIPAIISAKEQPVGRIWGCSESSEGSDDSLPWGGGVCRSSVDSVDSSVPLLEPETREQRIQRYKEARRRENEARSRRVLEEDARRRRARAEENNNNLPKILGSSSGRTRVNRTAYTTNDNDDLQPRLARKETSSSTQPVDVPITITRYENSIVDRLPPVKPSESGTVRFEENHRNEDDKRNNNSPKNNGPNNNSSSAGIFRSEICERRSRARERRIVRDKGQQLPQLQLQLQQQSQQFISVTNVETLRERKERLALLSSRIPVPRQTSQSCPRSVSSDHPLTASPKSPGSPSTSAVPPCEEDVAKLLERCQRVDHYVPVREKLTLFESLSRLGGRLARSTEDLGRTSSKPSPRGKQRARSLHDLNRGARAVPVREMCRFFEGDVEQEACQKVMAITKSRFSDPPSKNTWKEPSAKHEAPCISASSRRRHYFK
ncbi:uncharacterized protein LOC105188721 isoform X2 [Harpegnathos saltator]|uniref:PH domain-containing protein n=2 Tax=Harpegnathos saltator TaxID=610380 RepID=E2C0T5_HARSA|nr:uncharacterized protein LOC105188721 isoform X2 [Harpegnathos saltator]XP_025156611.1 uncharacterized protein LOC105188721 isoform X2 [Harpegnathos saltator]XP_025156612.1 uncharacterized protein LOC105188721 isoform X2 [Harpegnathos saltator]EFN78479.1 hypothetical protein EAI_13351 [Harpegnathos saltator]